MAEAVLSRPLHEMPLRFIRRVNPDTAIPASPPPDRALVTPEYFGIPAQACFTPKELAGYLRVSSDEIIGLIEEGELEAFPVHRGARTTYRIAWISLCYYFMRQQGAMN